MQKAKGQLVMLVAMNGLLLVIGASISGGIVGFFAFGWRGRLSFRLAAGIHNVADNRKQAIVFSFALGRGGRIRVGSRVSGRCVQCEIG